jgi:hypothetical protein
MNQATAIIPLVLPPKPDLVADAEWFDAGSKVDVVAH